VCRGKEERERERERLRCEPGKERVWVERISRLHTDHFDALANSSVQLTSAAFPVW
jgi:hypothetical protein